MITNIIFRRSDSPITSDKSHYENVPFEVPSSWVWTTLGEISNYGTTFNIQVEDIGKNEWILELEDIEKETANIIQRLSVKERSVKGTRHKFSAGNILYSKLRTYLNKVLVAPAEGYCTTEIMPFDTYGIISNEYICHVLRSPFFLDYTLQCGYGVKMPRLSTTDACNGMIPLPPLKEQIRIVEAIKHWFAKIDMIESGKENLHNSIKQSKSKILDLAIHGKLVPQDPTDEPAAELLKRINPKAEITCDNGHYQKLPEGWCECKLSDVCVFDNGYAFSSDNYNDCGIPLIRISNITNTGSIDLSSCVFIQDVPSNKFIVKSGDLLIAMSGATTGKMGVYLYEEDALLNQRVGNLKCTDAMLQQYRNYYMFAKSDYILKIAYGGAQPNISAKAILDIDVMLPPLNEQHRIVAKIEEIFAQLDAIETSL